MRLSQLALPALLTLSISACAANVGAAASTAAGPAQASAGAGVALQNRGEALRLMERNYPELLRDARVTGEVFVQVTLDAAGAVTASTVTRSTQDSFSAAALRVAEALRFSAPPVAGTRVNVRMLFAEAGAATITVVR